MQLRQFQNIGLSGLHLARHISVTSMQDELRDALHAEGVPAPAVA